METYADVTRTPEEAGKRYITNKPVGMIRAFKKGKITEKQLRGHLKKYVNVDENIPINDVIRVAEKTIDDIRKM